MSVLVDFEIKNAIESGRVRITPYSPDLIQPNSLDIRLGNSFVKFNGYSTIDTRNPNTFSDSAVRHVINDDEGICINTHEFMLAETLEDITLPRDIVCQIDGKSSIARLGLSLHQTGGWIDAGFSGTITLELYNAGNRGIALYPGMSIGQLVFFKTEPCLTSYGEKQDSHYMHQKGATISRYGRKIRELEVVVANHDEC